MKKDNDENGIYVTKPFLPPIEDYQEYIKRIWQSNRLTNQGELLRELESELKKYLEVDNLHFISNGTISLQLALNSLDITEGEVITTPFSYVATTSAILWERCEPVFVDIENSSLCIDPEKIENAITDKTRAILAVHVFGIPCQVDRIDEIAKKHNLKVIYDGAHAFGVKYQGKSLLSFGDVSTCSFHATKPFHTIEGGCVIAKDKSVSDLLELKKRFGHHGDEHYCLGINAKATEFQAAMGLCNFNYLEEIIKFRRTICNLYMKLLSGLEDVTLPLDRINFDQHNFAYFPVIFKNEKILLNVIKGLNEKNIYPRRYFYPSLNKLPYLSNKQDCPISDDIVKRIICLPLYYGLSEEKVSYICKIIKERAYGE